MDINDMKMDTVCYVVRFPCHRKPVAKRYTGRMLSFLIANFNQSHYHSENTVSYFDNYFEAADEPTQRSLLDFKKNNAVDDDTIVAETVINGEYSYYLLSDKNKPTEWDIIREYLLDDAVTVLILSEEEAKEFVVSKSNKFYCGHQFIEARILIEDLLNKGPCPFVEMDLNS